jgi:hypothetical protein
MIHNLNKQSQEPLEKDMPLSDALRVLSRIFDSLPREVVRLDDGTGESVRIEGYALTQFSSLTPADRGPISRAYLELKNKT